MIIFKTEDQIEQIRKANLVVSDTLAEVAKMLGPGVTGVELDKMAEAFIASKGGRPAFKGYNGFPSSLCISLNEQVVHGIPSEVPFKDGDIVSVDCGVELNGFFGDAAYTFAIGNVKPEVMKLLSVTLESLYKGIEMAVAGQRLGDISYAVQNHTERVHKYGVVKDLVGHGVGIELHEEPEVPNYGKRGSGPLLKEGLVIAIEPMINMGRRDVKQLSDKWTIVTADRLPSAHYEHSVAVRKKKADILSTHAPIEEAIKNNPNLREIPRNS